MVCPDLSGIILMDVMFDDVFEYFQDLSTLKLDMSLTLSELETVYGWMPQNAWLVIIPPQAAAFQVVNFKQDK